ncbi:DUF4044 domain-containing protein [Amphibacillus jilinensis]|nr:DUF4044 domain-containing protein [Amphibacillus jilinensis]
MAKTKKQKQDQNLKSRKPSKRERRNKMIVYIMIIAMIGSIFTTGLAVIL